VLALAGVPLSEVIAELERRTAQSGLAEKASRDRS
jgi:phosphoribosyl-ATP pyrophosphohydrolase